MEVKKKKVPIGLVIAGVLVVFLAVYYCFTYFTTTPEEKAYAAAVKRVVELSDEAYNKKNQEKEEEESSKSYVEEIAKEQEEEARPYFDEYRKEYVKKEEGGYLVELPVQEILNSIVVNEYIYEIHVVEKDGTYHVSSMEKKDSR